MGLKKQSEEEIVKNLHGHRSDTVEVTHVFSQDVLEQRRKMKINELKAGIEELEVTLRFVKDEISRDPTITGVEASLLLINRRAAELMARVDGITLAIAEAALDKQAELP